MNSRSYNNIIHFPFFVYYLTYANLDFRIPANVNINNFNFNNVHNIKNINFNFDYINQKIVPKKFCCTFITNPNATIRNTFIDEIYNVKK